MHNMMRSLLCVWRVLFASSETEAAFAAAGTPQSGFPSQEEPIPGKLHHSVSAGNAAFGMLQRNHQTHSAVSTMISKPHDHDSNVFGSTAMLDQTKHKAEVDNKALNGEYGRQRPSMLPARDAETTLSGCVSSGFGIAVFVLLSIVVFMGGFLQRQIQRQARLQKQVRANLAKLHAEQRLLASEDEKSQALQALEQEEKVLLKAIHDRGYVIYDEGRREFLLQKEIAFVPEFKGQGERPPNHMVRAVDAQFADPALAKAILSDFAEILRILKTSVVLIEGHTAGASLGEVGDYEHDVADARAALIKLTIVHLGIPEFRLATLGLPGFLGNGKDDVVLKMIN
eukprot:gnl/MRDRNA2_/MRDRNA2_97167_c0_seq1.p1 gnl/MRDRNA2_/MRDRNA2_97167_c0~~gnl/MRDRNA2_/MRDRNA2_97167_c0_seq1.p1  ORF type:complete len:341 (-),score=84.43 gnl/MRDRNA2_/MRDRNA2_97167_c0_seq1:91-1113(-)